MPIEPKEQPTLTICETHLKYGMLVEREVFKFTDEFESRWNQWLDDNFDPGHYDDWKDRERLWSDYINGKPKRWGQTFMPAAFVREIVAAIAEGVHDGRSAI